MQWGCVCWVKEIRERERFQKEKKLVNIEKIFAHHSSFISLITITYISILSLPAPLLFVLSLQKELQPLLNPPRIPDFPEPFSLPSVSVLNAGVRVQDGIRRFFPVVASTLADSDIL